MYIKWKWDFQRPVYNNGLDKSSYPNREECKDELHVGIIRYSCTQDILRFDYKIYNKTFSIGKGVSLFFAENS